ncbi:response regulator [Schauerella aestuarii]|uniref:response regulator n=1 Tax=Schauerella aestuarii TaxID=2511204 RepID=UPI0013720AB1|nr:response regulator [Achromobacter aestuarii]MYZ43759.1 response regulator [Achromobacter aestuarii]
MARILVVDDEVGIRELLSEILYDEGHTVELAENAAQARTARLRARPDLVLLDIWMPDTDGVSLLKEWGSQGLLDMPVIMMSGHATIDTAVEATRIGAMDFLEKPITLQRLLKTIASGLARGRAPQAVAATPVFAPAALAASAADTDRPVTIPAAAPAVPEDTSPNATGSLGSISLDQPLRDARDEFERIYFEYHLGRENHSMTRVSEKTGLERTHLYRKLKQLGIESARKRNA